MRHCPSWRRLEATAKPRSLRARDYFERVRDASRDAQSARQQLESASTGAVQAIRANALRKRIERDEQTIDAAQALLYETLADKLSGRHADVLWLRYCEDRPWKQVAHALGISITTAREAANEALRYCDDHNLT